MKKKRIALNLTVPNSFLKDVPGVTTIVNHLLTKEFGNIYLEYQEDNDLFEAMKIIAARKLKQRIQKEYETRLKTADPIMIKPTKRSIALHLDPQNDFMKDVTGIGLIVNYLISEKFGYDCFINNDENDILEAHKIIQAVRYVKEIKEEKEHAIIESKLQ
jgi:ppGpp synthetase/RelA/SpoT-type nucleotidyltranferase